MHRSIGLSKQKTPDDNDVTKPTAAHSRAAQEVVELDPADGCVRLEVGELVSEQNSRHGRFFSNTGLETLMRRALPTWTT